MSLSNYFPFSETKTIGIPKWQMILFQTKLWKFFFFCDSGQWFCLNPFYEVVDPYDKELELPYCHREGSYYVQPLLGEQPVGAHWCKFLQWLSYDVVEVLALVTRLHVGLGVLLHCRPIVSYLYQFVNQASMPSSDSYILLRGLL